MADKPEYLTEEGRQKLKAELDHLRNVKLPEVAQRIHQAKEFSNAIDNPEYDEAKNEQAFIDGRIQTIENILRNATIIQDKPAKNGVVNIGCWVKLRNEDDADEEDEEYHIVGSAEANPREHRISNESPVGRAVIGKRLNDQVQVVVPSGVVRYRVVEVR